MPAFTSLPDADAWRAVHAPARKSPQTSPKKEVEVGEKNARVSGTTTTHASNQATTDTKSDGGSDKSPARPPREPPPERVDVEKFVNRNADFDALMIAQAEELPQIAHGLVKRAAARAEPGAISAATKNWHEASKAAADVRERFIEIQKETRALIPIDDVEDVVATELREVRKFLKKLGARAAAAANPAEPAVAQAAIDRHVDELLALFEPVLERVRVELVPAESQPV